MAKVRLVAGCFAIAEAIALAPLPAAAYTEVGPYAAVGLGFDHVPDRDLSISGNTVSS